MKDRIVLIQLCKLNKDTLANHTTESFNNSFNYEKNVNILSTETDKACNTELLIKAKETDEADALVCAACLLSKENHVDVETCSICYSQIFYTMLVSKICSNI